MRKRQVESASSHLETLFHLGVVTGLSDAQLLERFTAQSDQGGELAFEAIVRRHGLMVLGVCRRVLRHEQAAEDAFQATFMVLALKAPDVRSGDSLGPWLHSVAVRIARRALDSIRRYQPEPLPAEDPVQNTVPDPDLADLPAVIDEELARLPEKYRRPVVMCYLEGQTQEEAARALGWTKGTVSGRLARAKDLLRHRLARRGLAPSAGLAAAMATTEPASAAVPASLLAATVRNASAAVLGGAEAGLVAGSVASMARAALRWMRVARVVRAAAQCLVLGLSVAAVAVGAVGLAGPGGGVAVTGGIAPAAARPVSVPGTRVDRSGDPLPPGVLVRLGTLQRRHNARVVGMGFARDGRLVSVQGDGLARFWDDQTGRQVRAESLLGNASDPDLVNNRVAFSADGRLVALSGFGLDPDTPRGPHAVLIWELEPHRLRRRLEVEVMMLEALAFSPDGATLATSGFGGDIPLWDVETGTRQSVIKTGRRIIRSLSFAPDGTSLVATGQGQDVMIWDVPSGRGSPLAKLKGSGSPPRFSPDGRLLAVPELGAGIVLWDRADGRERARIPGTALVFAPDGQSMAVTGRADGMLTVIDTPDGHVRWKADIAWGMTALPPVFSPDGTTLVRESDGILRFFDAGSGRERSSEDDVHQGKLAAVRFAPDGRSVIAVEFGGPIRVWDPVSARPLGEFRQDSRIATAAVSPDGGRLATAAMQSRGVLSVWDLATRRVRTTWTSPGQNSQVMAVAFSPDGESVLIYTNNRQFKVFEVATGRERPAVPPRLKLPEYRPPFGGTIMGAAFSPGNRFLAVREGQAVHVADLATGDERFSRPCLAMAFAPDGTTLAVAPPLPPVVNDQNHGKVPSFTLDSEVIDLMDLNAGTSRRTVIPRKMVAALAFSPDGNLLAVASWRPEPTVRLYRTDDGREIESFPLPVVVRSKDALAFSPDGHSLAAGLDDTTILIWEVRNGY